MTLIGFLTAANQPFWPALKWFLLAKWPRIRRLPTKSFRAKWLPTKYFPASSKRLLSLAVNLRALLRSRAQRANRANHANRAINAPVTLDATASAGTSALSGS
jgi:hypothetical protein